MKVVCAWCQHEMKPAFLRDVEPLDDPTETHGICDVHHAVVLQQIFARPGVPDTRVERGDPGEEQAHLLRLQAWTSEGADVAAALIDRLAAEMASLEPRAAAAEAERAHLETLVARAREDVRALRQERDELVAVRQEAGRLATMLLERTLDEALQPLHALVELLRPGVRRRASIDAVRRAVDSGDDSA